MADPLTVLLAAESAYGPTGNCIGIGAELLRAGHRVVFAAEESWEGQLAPLGFEERLVAMAPPPEEPVAAGQGWIDFVRDTAPHFRTSTLEQITTVLEPIWQELLAGARHADPQFAEVVAEVRPDVVAQDNVSSFPALVAAGVPWVRLVSCNPLEIPGAGVPPALSGLPTDDPSGWAEWRAEYARVCGPVQAAYDEFCRERGAPGLPPGQFAHDPAVGVYVWPAAADYVDRRPLGPAWTRVHSSVRRTEQPVELPPEVAAGDGALVYLSMGSLGGADVELMRRLVGMLEGSGHRVVVSKGPRADEYHLPPGMWGAARLPQTQVLPQCDLVITHGGANTTCETFAAGLPMVVLPLFWDQYDNAQRVAETGHGVRLDTYRVERHELLAAVDGLLGDAGVRERCRRVGAEVRADAGVVRAAEVLAGAGLAGRGGAWRPEPPA